MRCRNDQRSGKELNSETAKVGLGRCGNSADLPLPSGIKFNDLLNDRGKVAIFLCTYRGQSYLAEQLNSFFNQTYSNWEVWASDDGSDDGTCGILDAYKKKWSSGRLNIQAGPARGAAINFLSLTCSAHVKADYYAYSDQDDVWEADKLERAVRWLSSVPPQIPALYCSRARLIDSQNSEIGLSPLFSRPPSFANALIQNIASGNTMVFNEAARDLLCDAGESVPCVIHDWWVYMVVTGCGGKVFYDSHPTIRYRQHDDNLIGINASWRARFKRAWMYCQGRFRCWSDGNIAALYTLQAKLTSENREILEVFARAREMSLIPRLCHLKRSGIYRQTVLGNMGLIAAAILKKI